MGAFFNRLISPVGRACIDWKANVRICNALLSKCTAYFHPSSAKYDRIKRLVLIEVGNISEKEYP
jgi:hypothetical protein